MCILISSVRIPKVVHCPGTRENDIGLFVLEEEVRWPSDPVAACVGTGSLTATNCVVVGFDNNEEITTVRSRVASQSYESSNSHNYR